MIDCSTSEQIAIQTVFGSTVRQATNDTGDIHTTFRAELKSLLNAKSEEQFNKIWSTFKTLYETNYSDFVEYLETSWLPKKKNWALAWRLDVSFHTNNMMEAYHSALKSLYLGKSGSARVDRVVYLVTQVLEIDYRGENLQKNLGLHKTAGARKQAPAVLEVSE
ncbi:uncharacterized protein EV154DRAFT_386150, partial [Mucor mucedo]|uniref:uncharacterized protein n=1 Tax=Mucor mucedo TaxID=29922 RepID=UPI002220004C